MTDITVYDPPMCCSTGICGADIDQKLVNFAADLDWLKSTGVDVQRINLSQEPAQFVENAQVKDILDKSGVEGLPAIFLGDTLLSSGQYPARSKLAELVGLSTENIAGDEVPENTGSGCCGSAPAEKSSADSCCGSASAEKSATNSCC